MSCNERWERTRRFLLHNFLVNPGFQLSPIPEEARSSSCSSPDSLPELLVEPEPDRHDQPPEYYDELERRMRSYYRQLFCDENSADFDNEFEHFETNDIQREERSYDFDKDELEAIDVVTEDKVLDSDKDISAAEDVVTEEYSADLDGNEDEFEENCVEEDNYESDKDDVPDANDQQTTSASSGKDADESDAKDVVTEEHSTDKDESESEANEIVATEAQTDFDKNLDLYGAADEVRREIRYSSDKEEGIAEENLLVTKEHSSEANEVVVEAVSTINENQFTDTENLDDNHVEIPQKDRLSTDNLKEHSSIEEEEVENHNLVESRSGYFMVSNYRKDSDIDLNKNIEHDDSQANGDQEDAAIKSHDYSDLNKRLEATDEELSKAKTTSDSDESGPCHIISSTVVEIHESRPVLMRKLEDVSPVLVPKFVRVSRGVSVPGDRRDANQCSSSSLNVSDEIIERASSDNDNEMNKDQADIEEPDTEVQRLLSASEVTNVSHKPQTDDEESIDLDEFHSTKIAERSGTDISDWDNDKTDENSFEMALRRGVFESKSVRKTHIQRSDEEMYTTDEDFEPVEEIRAPREFGNRHSLYKVSVDTEGSPALAFETQANADKLEEVSSDSHEIHASLERGDERTSSKDLYQTPPVPNIINDIWSVSPMELDIEQLLTETAQDKKRKLDPRPEEKPIKRKRKDVAIQTSQNQNWEHIKSNFFVGKPLVLRLCGCSDHVCSRPTYQTS